MFEGLSRLMGAKRVLFYSAMAAAFLASALLVSPQAYAEDAGALAKIVSVQGHANVKDGQTGDVLSAQKGSIIAEGAQISTDDNGMVFVGLGEGLNSAAKIQPDSQVTVTSLNPVKLTLESGKVHLMVRGLAEGSTFQVTSPTAVASARGTGWTQTVDSVDVFDGSVQVEAGGETIEVPAGMGCSTEAATVGELTPVAEAAVDEFNSFEGEVAEAQSAAGTTAASAPAEASEEASTNTQVPSGSP